MARPPAGGYNWSYEETEQFVSDSIALRQFCRVYLASVPDDTVLIRWSHYPTDSTLLEDSVRVIARTVKKAKELIPTLSRSVVRDFSRSAKCQVLSILKLGRTDEAKMAAKRAYQRLCETTRRAVTAAKRVKDALNGSEAAKKLLQNTIVPRTEIRQIRRRVVQGQDVPAEEKLVSIFEPTTSLSLYSKWRAI